jgi:hypothetical protein
MDIIENLCRETSDINKFLLENSEISMNIFIDSNMRKSILLASASYFEREITHLVVNFVKQSTENRLLLNFVQKKAVSRQYHTFFNWDGKNCNSFTGLFGEDFKRYFAEKVKADESLEQSIKCFLEIGSERNRMVHQDFGQYTLEKTSDEILLLHRQAKVFLEILTASLNEEIPVEDSQN